MAGWFTLIVSTAILLWLIFKIRTSRRFNLVDHWLHHKLVKNRDSFGWQVVAFLNDPKLMVVWAVLLASFLLNQNHYLTALWVLATLGFSDLIGIFLKHSIKRKRPIMHSDKEEGFSFPSGHVLGATTMALILQQLFGKQLGLSFLIVLLTGWLLVVISRLSLKAHYPSDILGAACLAVACFSLAQQIYFVL